MRQVIVTLLCAAAAAWSLAAIARPVVDGRLQVETTKDGKYVVDSNKLGKAEFFGVVGDFVETKKITGIVLIKSERASDEQKHIIAITATTQHIDAFADQDGKIVPLVDPAPSKVEAAPALDAAAPAAH